jgi:hypothetical protein
MQLGRKHDDLDWFLGVHSCDGDMRGLFDFVEL